MRASQTDSDRERDRDIRSVESITKYNICSFFKKKFVKAIFIAKALKF